MNLSGTPHIIQFGAGEEITPGSSRVSPFDSQRLGWVPWGPDNLYPNRFLGYFETNPVYNAVVDENARMILGDSMEFEGSGAQSFAAFLEAQDPSGELLDAVSMDLAMYNAAALYVVPAVGGGISQMRHYCFANLRSSLIDTQTGKVPAYWYSPDWSAVNTSGKVAGRARGEWRQLLQPVEIPLIETAAFRQPGLLVVQAKAPGGSYYPSPAGEAARFQIELAYHNVQIQLKQLENGIFAQMQITVPFDGDATTQEGRQKQDEIVRHIQQSMQGSFKAGNALVTFVHPSQLREGVVPKYEKLDTDMADKRYLENNRLIDEAVLTALGVVSPELYAIARPSGFSSQAESLEASMRLQISRLRPQKRLLSRLLIRLAGLAGYQIQDVVINTEPPSMAGESTGVDGTEGTTNTPDNGN